MATTGMILLKLRFNMKDVIPRIYNRRTKKRTFLKFTFEIPLTYQYNKFIIA